jgi:hypothetical protein
MMKAPNSRRRVIPVQSTGGGGYSVHGRIFSSVALLLLLTLGGCDSSSTGVGSTPSATTPPATATLSSLPIDCPNSSQPTIQRGAMLTLQPSIGAVGTQVAVAITGLQPGCHLFLDIEVAPILSETHGTPIPGPREAQTGIQWITVSAAGDVHTTFCVCHPIYTYAIGYPPYPDVTPPPTTGGNVGAYGPNPGDYFFITIAGPNIPTPPTLFAKFTVTQ